MHIDEASWSVILGVLRALFGYNLKDSILSNKLVAKIKNMRLKKQEHFDQHVNRLNNRFGVSAAIPSETILSVDSD